MAASLEAWLAALEAASPRDVVRVHQRRDPRAYQTTALAAACERSGHLSVVVCEDVCDLAGEYGTWRLATNVFACRAARCLTLGLAADQSGRSLLEAYLARKRASPSTLRVGPDEAPVRQVVETPADLRRLPWVRHNELDGGYYFTPIVAARAPDTERYNISWNRCQYLDPGHLAIYMSPRHLWGYFREREEQGQSLRAAIVLGHAPGFHMAGAGLTTLDQDEYELAAAVVGEPLRLVPSVTWGEELLLPADAEALIEGEIVAGRRTVEGPYGEFHGYYGPQRISWLFRATAVCRRRRPTLLDIFSSHRDNFFAHLPIEADFYGYLRNTVPCVRDVAWLDLDGPFTAVIQIAKRTDGEAMRAAMGLLALSNIIKIVVVVDTDVELRSQAEVLWAVSTRLAPERGVHLIEDVQGSALDPSLEGEVRGTALVLDATKPLGRPFAIRAEPPAEAVRQAEALLRGLRG